MDGWSGCGGERRVVQWYGLPTNQSELPRGSATSIDSQNYNATWKKPMIWRRTDCLVHSRIKSPPTQNSRSRVQPQENWLALHAQRRTCIERVSSVEHHCQPIAGIGRGGFALATLILGSTEYLLPVHSIFFYILHEELAEVGAFF